ncbi:hypothetical protein ASC61_04425 [Aeromicrobium sp. Root344]|uniref:DUF5667 domain-containing protein n=1 Tax=Aeromicrobium sp. Root344 TaxID=1736521 RepID=UPI0006F3C0C3|nr:DUF5667 domain-containing protein [Aeromicrobium sp. Root344]KQV74304.1 hypothetical protein ASC61_04425 [Aeromicrobium sp. Root344]
MIGRRSHDDAQSFEEAWSGRTPRDEHIADLVRFAETLCEAAVAEPTPMFRESLRTQLMSEAETVLVAMPAKPSTSPTRTPEASPVRRRVAGLTAALVASAGVVGIVASSASAVPGEMLYPVKRSVESVELALHRDDASRGSFQLRQAAERLAEARELSGEGASESLIAQTLQDFSSQAEAGSTALFSDYTGNGEKKSIRTVNDFAVAATADLSALSSQLPPGADDPFEAATATITELATQASSLCSACTTGDLQQLVASVKDLSVNPTSSSGESSDGKSGKPSSSDAKTPAAPASSQSADKPIVALPLPTTAPTTKAPSLTDLTDPVIGAVLGDENQEGLIPGLLNGLLGKK